MDCVQDIFDVFYRHRFLWHEISSIMLVITVSKAQIESK